MFGYKKIPFEMFDYDLDRVVPYATKWSIDIPNWKWLGRFAGGTIRVHKFYQGEPEWTTMHDHEYDFWTVPMRDYMEESVNPVTGQIDETVIRKWRVTYRHAELFHAVRGRWYAGNYGTGVTNKFDPFYTIGIGLKRRRNFSILRFVALDDGLDIDYHETMEEHDYNYDPRPHWMICEFDPVNDRETGVRVPMFPGVENNAVTG